MGTNINDNGFDQEEWKKVQRQLQKTWDEYAAAGKTSDEFIGFAAEMLGCKGKPYFDKFIMKKILDGEDLSEKKEMDKDSRGETEFIHPDGRRWDEAPEAKYPFPDRSKLKPNFSMKDRDDQLDIHYIEGIFDDGRPFRMESWASGGFSYATFYLSRKGIENFSPADLKEYLKSNEVIEFDDRLYLNSGFGDSINLSSQEKTDTSGNPIWEITIIVGDEDGTYVHFPIRWGVKNKNDWQLKGYPKETSVDDDPSEEDELDQPAGDDAVVRTESVGTESVRNMKNTVNRTTEEKQSPEREEESSSIKKTILDDTVNALRDISAKLRGDDSALADPWEEIKDQVQNGLSLSWTAYVDTMKGIIEGNVKGLSEENRQALAVELKVNSEDIERLCTKTRFRLIDRARKEKIRYAPFDFEYFRYSVKDFDIYCQILERTGMYRFRIAGYSVAVPDGEEGEMSTHIIEDTMSKEEFDQARQMNWPEDWEERQLEFLEDPEDVRVSSSAEESTDQMEEEEESSPPEATTNKAPKETSIKNNEIDKDKWDKVQPMLKKAWDECVATGRPMGDFVGLVVPILSPGGQPYFEKFLTKKIEDGEPLLGQEKEDKGLDMAGELSVPEPEGDHESLSWDQIPDDDPMWVQSKPLFQKMLDSTLSAGKSVDEFAKLVGKEIGGKAGPYFEKFVREELGEKKSKAKKEESTGEVPEKTREVANQNSNQPASRLSSELMEAGITLAGFHIEAGTKDFADLTKAVIADLGDNAEKFKPYFRSWYEAIRYYPGIDTEGMTPAAEITDADIEAIGEAKDSTTEHPKQESMLPLSLRPKPRMNTHKEMHLKRLKRGIAIERERFGSKTYLVAKWTHSLDFDGGIFESISFVDSYDSLEEAKKIVDQLYERSIRQLKKEKMAESPLTPPFSMPQPSKQSRVECVYFRSFGMDDSKVCGGCAYDAISSYYQVLKTPDGDILSEDLLTYLYHKDELISYFSRIGENEITVGRSVHFRVPETRESKNGTIVDVKGSIPTWSGDLDPAKMEITIIFDDLHKTTVSEKTFRIGSEGWGMNNAPAATRAEIEDLIKKYNEFKGNTEEPDIVDHLVQVLEF